MSYHSNDTKKTFKQFIAEAAVSTKRVDKAVETFVRLLARKLGTNFYRFGGPKGVTEIKNGIGFLYFYNVNKAIRFNYVDGDIESITLWNRYVLGQNGDKTISFKGIGLTNAGKKLLAILSGEETDKNGKHYFDLNEDFEEDDEEYIMEARRITIPDAIEIVSKYYSEDEMKTLTKKQIKDAIESEGYSYPTALSKYAKNVPGYRAKIFDLYSLSMGVETPASTGVIDIKSGDSQTTRDIVPGMKSKAKEMETKAREIMAEPTKEQIEELRKKVDSKFNVLENLVRVIARDAAKSLIVYGSAGVGKCAARDEKILFRLK